MTIESTFYILLIALLIAISIIDLKQHIIPNQLTLTIFILAIIFNLYKQYCGIPFTHSIMGGIKAGVPVLVVSLITCEKIGMGDVKLAGVLGFYLDWETVSSTAFFSCITLVLVVTVLLAARIKRPIPLGPFFSIGVFTALLLR